MTFEKIRFLNETDTGREYPIPEDVYYFPDVCYLDGSPVVITKENPIVIKVGKKRWLKVKWDYKNAGN